MTETSGSGFQWGSVNQHRTDRDVARLKHRPPECVERLVNRAPEQHLPRRACRRRKRPRAPRIAEGVDGPKADEIESVAQQTHALAPGVLPVEVGKDPPGIDGIAV